MSIEKLARQDLWSRDSYNVTSPGVQPCLRLNCNENPWPPVGSTDPLIHRYPDKQPAELVDRLAKLYQVSSTNILVTRGADDGIDALIRSFCMPGQDWVVQCSPAFVMYRFFAELQAVSVIDVPLNPDGGFEVDFAQLGMESRPETESSAKIFFLCSPNNPTGSMIDAGRILEFADRVADQSLVVVDEAYIEFSSSPGLATEVSGRKNLVVLRTLSKAWSLAGARLGVVVGCPELISFLSRTTSPYPLSRSAIAAAMSATTPEHLAIARERIEQLKGQREELQSLLGSMAFVDMVYPSQANFLLTRVRNASRLLEFMSQQGILLRDQSRQPGLENHVRISVGTEMEMKQLADAMRKFEVTR